MGTVSSPQPSVPEAALTECLREVAACAILRNEDDLFGNLQRGGDVDLIVADLKLAERTLIRHLGTPVRIVRSSYVAGYSYDWGRVDLVPAIEWRGARYLSVGAVLDGRQLSPRGRPVPRLAHQAVISWLTSLLFGGFFKERYAADIRKAVESDGSVFRQTLTEVAGKKWGTRLYQAAVAGRAETSQKWTSSLRRVVWWRACFKSPVQTVRRFFAYVLGELRLRFKPPVPWILIVGSDETARLSFVNDIVVHFAACPYGAVKAVHWRPRSRLSLLPPVIQWLMDYWTQFVHLRAKSYILAFDRAHLDFVQAFGRNPRGAGAWCARALWWLLPKPDLVFVLDSEPGVSIDEIQRVIRAWLLDRSIASVGAVHATKSSHPSGTLA